MFAFHLQIFHFLEQDASILQVDNPAHIWCLHYVFLPRINRAMERFIQQWNLHGIRTEVGCPSPKTLFVEVTLLFFSSKQYSINYCSHLEQNILLLDKGMSKFSYF